MLHLLLYFYLEFEALDLRQLDLEAQINRNLTRLTLFCPYLIPLIFWFFKLINNETRKNR